MLLAFGGGGGTTLAKYLLGESPTETAQGALAQADMIQRSMPQATAPQR